MSSETQCPSCDRDDFAGKSGMRNHHYQTHGESIAYVELVCSFCGEEYEELSCRESRSEYCSKDCHLRSQEETFAGAGNPAYDGGSTYLVCDWCDEDFRGQETHDNTFCSQECYGEWQSENRVGEDAAGYNGGNKRFHAAIRDSVAQCREGRSWHRTRKEYQNSHDMSCSVCGDLPEEHSNDLHHIIPVLAGGVHHDDLLMPLCMSCHRSVEAYTKTFTESHLLP